jgi:hypothetical protein
MWEILIITDTGDFPLNRKELHSSLIFIAESNFQAPASPAKLAVSTSSLAVMLLILSAKYTPHDLTRE